MFKLNICMRYDEKVIILTFFCVVISGCRCMSDAFPQISKQYIRYGVTNEWDSCNKTFFFRTFLPFSIIPIPLEIIFNLRNMVCPF